MKLSLLSFLLISAVTFSGCSDNTAPPAREEKFVTDEFTDLLKDAKIYLTYEEVTAFDESEPFLQEHPRVIRNYAISNGTYTNAAGGDGYYLNDYTGATYAIIISVMSGTDLAVTPGVYAQPVNNLTTTGDLGTQQWTSFGKQGFIMSTKSPVRFPDKLYATIESNDESSVPVVIKGGMNPGNTMTITFSGAISIVDPDHLPGTHPSYKGTGDLYVKAKVVDALGVPRGGL